MKNRFVRGFVHSIIALAAAGAGQIAFAQAEPLRAP